MFYNTAAEGRAGSAKPARTWSTLQGELLKLRDVADIDCPYASSDQVAVHLENLAPVNGQLFTSNNNGLDAVTKKTPAPTMQFDTLYMRHISLMVSWKRSLLFMAHTADNGADKLFAKGECAVTSNSGSFGQFLATKSLSFGVAPLPYYDQATSNGGQPVSGSALWAMEGHPKDQGKGHGPVPGLAVQARGRRRMAPAHRLSAADRGRFPRVRCVVLQEHSRSASRDRFHERPSVRQQPRLPHGELHAY